MGACIKRTSAYKEHQWEQSLKRCPLYNEHSHIQSQLRFGIVGEKTEDGEIHVGIKATKVVKRDREYSSVNGSPKVEHIPSIEEVMENSEEPQKFEMPE